MPRTSRSSGSDLTRSAMSDRPRLPSIELPRIQPTRSTCRGAPPARRKNFRQSQQPRARNFSSASTDGETKISASKESSPTSNADDQKTTAPNCRATVLAVHCDGQPNVCGRRFYRYLVSELHKLAGRCERPPIFPEKSWHHALKIADERDRLKFASDLNS